jgi:hypothetical protein
VWGLTSLFQRITGRRKARTEEGYKLIDVTGQEEIKRISWRKSIPLGWQDNGNKDTKEIDTLTFDSEELKKPEDKYVPEGFDT